MREEEVGEVEEVEEVYVDLEVFAEVDDDSYLATISKRDLNSLVSFDERLVIRHWDGDKPVRLGAYGENAVRTESDANEDNNLDNLSRLTLPELLDIFLLR